MVKALPSTRRRSTHSLTLSLHPTLLCPLLSPPELFAAAGGTVPSPPLKMPSWNDGEESSEEELVGMELEQNWVRNLICFAPRVRVRVQVFFDLRQ